MDVDKYAGKTHHPIYFYGGTNLWYGPNFRKDKKGGRKPI
jgi:hypothetical protein